jgi:predicted dehydrogenase
VEVLLADRNRIDLVVVASPNVSHLPVARAVLAAGRPVVVDKPVAATAADGLRLVEDARERGLLLTVFQNRRWDGDFLTVHGLVGSGVLGTIWRMEPRFARARPLVPSA